MAKRIIPFFAALLLAACGGGGEAEQPKAQPTQAPEACQRVPYWQKSSVEAETVLPLAGKAVYPLWLPAASIKTVRGLNGTTYQAGRDYTVSGGNLVIPAGSTIPQAPADFPYTPDPASPYLSISKTKAGGGLLISDAYQAWQIAVTYAGTPAAPAAQAQLPAYPGKMDNGRVPSITVFGDSISGGATSTPGNSYAEILAATLGSSATVRNRSVAGWGAGNAVAAVEERLNDTAQDVVILAFGMNDAAWIDGADVFKAQLAAMISAVRAKAPSTEFVLLSGMRGNPDWSIMRADMFDGYRTAMRELAAELPGVVVVDFTSVWDSMNRKAFFDLAANGVNHPGNFVHGLYADVLLQALGPKGCRAH